MGSCHEKDLLQGIVKKDDQSDLCQGEEEEWIEKPSLPGRKMIIEKNEGQGKKCHIDREPSHQRDTFYISSPTQEMDNFGREYKTEGRGTTTKAAADQEALLQDGRYLFLSISYCGKFREHDHDDRERKEEDDLPHHLGD